MSKQGQAPGAHHAKQGPQNMCGHRRAQGGVNEAFAKQTRDAFHTWDFFAPQKRERCPWTKKTGQSDGLDNSGIIRIREWRNCGRGALAPRGCSKPMYGNIAVQSCCSKALPQIFALRKGSPQSSSAKGDRIRWAEKWSRQRAAPAKQTKGASKKLTRWSAPQNIPF